MPAAINFINVIQVCNFDKGMSVQPLTQVTSKSHDSAHLNNWSGACPDTTSNSELLKS